MQLIKIEKILSVSSEDPAFPASNLLKSDVGKHVKWKCKAAGEMNAIVVFQLAEAVTFSSIDIGNCGSAFIEIMVGKSCLPDADFKVLVLSKMVMTKQESKDEENLNSVIFFKPEDMMQPEATDKWDRVKITCSQPFNKHVQYGLSFVKFHSSSPTPVSPLGGSLGKFMLKAEESDDISPGSLFARRNELKIDDPEVEKKGSIAASIRAAAANLDAGPSKSPSLLPKKKKKENENTVKRKGISSVESTSSSPQFEPASKKPGTPKAEPVPKKQDAKTTPSIKASTSNTNIMGSSAKKRENALKKDSDEPARKKPRNQQDKADSIKKPKVKRTLPFERFMEGVVFVISGFQNPLRGDIRSKGIAMGAKYRADWDRSCTHLICAFPNTPKFNQVRGHGKIVKKEWIEDSYSKRIRLPWRRYALDRRDMSSPESEDEIYEQEDDPAIEDQVTAQSAISDDDYDDGPRPSLFPHLIKTPLKQDPGPSTSKQEEMDIDNDIAENTSPSEQMKDLDIDVPNGEDIDGYSTQSDPEWESEVDRECYPLPYLPSQFSGLSVFISDEYDNGTSSQLKRYIIAHAGKVHDSFNADVEFIISDQPDKIMKIKADNPLVVGIKSEWVWRCHDENRLLPISKFEI